MPRDEGPGGSGKRTARVLLADAEPLMRAALKMCLQRHGLMVCGEASDDQELLDVIARTMPDVCLLAPDVPVDGIRSTAALSARFPETAVVIFAPTEAYEDVLRAVRAGARGYLRRDTPCRSLARALSGVVKGEAGFFGRTVDHLVRGLRGPEVGFVVHAPRGRVTLSKRQIQVLRQLVLGATTADIARALSISAVTVRRHCADTCRKLGAPDRATAVELVRGQLSAS